MQIHEKIKIQRDRLSLTQKEVAKRLGMGRSSYQYWEKVDPSVEDIKRVAVVMGLNEDFFLVTPDDYFIKEDENVMKQKGDLNGSPADILLTGAQVTLQDHIDLLKHRAKELQADKERLFALLETNLAGLSNGQQVLYAFARVALELQALTTSGGDLNKAKELKDSLSISLSDYKQVDLRDDKAVSVRTGRSNQQS